MSIFSDGKNAGEKEPNPKRRRTTRPGKKSERRGEVAQDLDKAAVGNAKGEQNRTHNVHGFVDKNGSRTPASNGRKQQSDLDKHPSGSSNGVRQKHKPSTEAETIDGKSSKKRRRRRNKRGAGQHPDHASDVRNIRSMPKPSSDAQYSEPINTGVNTHQAPTKKTNKHSRRYPPLYAALDLGTNNCRLLIATPQERGRFRVVDGFSRIVRLGEGLEQSGELSVYAMDRAVEALKVCAEKLNNKKIKKYRLIATEACRQASNGEVFLDRVKKETGLDLEIVNRETEAHLAAEGCGSLMDRNADGAVLFDIGGGSSELILVDSSVGRNAHKRRIGDRIVAWTSLPMGVVTLAERFGGKHVTRELFNEMVRDVTQHIEAFEGRDALNEIFQKGNVHLLGTSGTVTTLAGIYLKLPRYERRRVDGIWLDDSDVDIVINRLIEMTYEERAANPCIGEERADLVLAGCAILNAIRLAWPASRLRVADRGLREGLLAQMMNSDGAWTRRFRDRRYPKKRNVSRQPKENGA